MRSLKPVLLWGMLMQRITGAPTRPKDQDDSPAVVLPRQFIADSFQIGCPVVTDFVAQLPPEVQAAARSLNGLINDVVFADPSFFICGNLLSIYLGCGPDFPDPRPTPPCSSTPVVSSLVYSTVDSSAFVPTVPTAVTSSSPVWQPSTLPSRVVSSISTAVDSVSTQLYGTTSKSTQEALSTSSFVLASSANTNQVLPSSSTSPITPCENSKTPTYSQVSPSITLPLSSASSNSGSYTPPPSRITDSIPELRSSTFSDVRSSTSPAQTLLTTISTSAASSIPLTFASYSEPPDTIFSSLQTISRFSSTPVVSPSTSPASPETLLSSSKSSVFVSTLSSTTSVTQYVTSLPTKIFISSTTPSFSIPCTEDLPYSSSYTTPTLYPQPSTTSTLTPIPSSNAQGSSSLIIVTSPSATRTLTSTVTPFSTGPVSTSPGISSTPSSSPWTPLSSLTSTRPAPVPPTSPTSPSTRPATPTSTAPPCPSGCPLDPSLLPALPSLPSSPGDLQSPITSGVIYQQTFTYSFYASTVVSVDGRILDPRARILVGLLPGGVVAALLCDGLHIGASTVVPYPPAWVVAVEALGILLPSEIGGDGLYVAN
ncbi:hypothetical protein B0J12DRAFT_738184 [Macrophomina phaseolina]|uniref:Uncharacterized protein n=1 Tax=Macrophomina phaseolina TaxID=35725 RepID=A0ABQ8GK68_9PEZI|nr:hypothetical protein B0J12DRAFT_738184 [Macrophomina phaseolina]